MGVDLLSVAKSGLFAAKKSLETTGHNIANVNTEGYSRQRVSQETNIPVGQGNLVHGTGVRVTGIKRVHDQHIEKRVRNTITDNNYYGERANQLGQVENIFNELNSEGLNKVLNKFFNSFRQLSNQPEDETIRSIVRENAKLVAKDFNRIKSTLRNIAKQIDGTMDRKIEEINQLLRNGAEINKKIAELEGIHGETGDLRDQRDLVVRQLSEYFKTHTYEDDKGNFIVNAEGVGTVITGVFTSELIASEVSASDSSSGLPGSMEIFLKSKPKYPITQSLRSGTISGLVKTRNNEIKDLMDRMDQLAYHFTNSVNAIHRRGFINKALPKDDQGRIIASAHNGKVTGLDFFKSLDSIEEAADNIQLSIEVQDDINNIATALAPNKPGDNRVSIAISKLQHEKMLGDGNQTLEEQYLESIGSIGISSNKASLDLEQSEGILAQTMAIKERISGVSLDEEAANMVKFQQAYDASAKVLKTTDQMFKSIINIMP